MFIRLVGVFEVRDGSGRDCTPRGAKARAILAMLCQTPDRRRARRWLEARLWSDRGAEQASGSLRQALMEIRKALGSEARRLATDRDTVRLEGVATDLEQDPDAASRALQSGREFLEGIDIIDPAFEDWLREERDRVEGSLGIRRPDQALSPMSETARLPFVIRLGGLPQGLGAFAGRALADAIARLLGEFAHIDVYGSGGTPVPTDLAKEGMALHVEGAEIARLAEPAAACGEAQKGASERVACARRLPFETLGDDVVGDPDEASTRETVAHRGCQRDHF